jgi:signal peptidase I
LETPQLAESEIPTKPIEEKTSFLRFFLDLLETLALSVLLFLGINALTARVLVEGFSMRPTLENGEYVLVNKMSYRSELPEYGDIVVFHFPVDPDQDFIKRVIALPGDEINVHDGQVMVNERVLNEPYIAATPQYVGTWHVPDDQIFVLGDNRNNSSDSHSWGAVPAENVIGKAILTYWPPPAWKALEHGQIISEMP